MRVLDRFFHLRERGSSVPTEVRAGFVTFLTLSYILFVNPQILADAGMPVQDVAVATALASAVATLVLGLWANLPLALAPGMGLNAYFTFGVVQSLGVDWRVALAAVFVEGVLFFVLALSGARSALMRAIPAPIKLATTGGIGLLLTLIGFQSSGITVAHPSTLVTHGDLSAGKVLLTVVGLFLMAVLLVRRFRGAILVGIVSVTGLCWLLGLAPPPEDLLTRPTLPQETFLALDFAGLLTGKMATVILAFLFVDILDTAGTLIGVGTLAGFVDEKGEMPMAGRAFAADAVGTSVGALLGTSTVTTYVESATGVEEGGRTGLTAVVVAGLFLVSLFFTPVLTAVPAVATAPALILVGSLMMGGVRGIDWSRLEDALPAFLTLAAIPLTFSIAHGISLGLISYVVVRTLAGKWRQLSPLVVILTLAMMAFYAFGELP